MKESRSSGHIRIKTRPGTSAIGDRVTPETKVGKLDTSDLIKSNRSKIEKLQKSNQVLLEEIDNEKKLTQRNASEAAKAIAKLKMEGNQFAEQIREELRKKELIASQIEECKIQIEKNRDLLKNPEDSNGTSGLWYS